MQIPDLSASTADFLRNYKESYKRLTFVMGGGIVLEKKREIRGKWTRFALMQTSANYKIIGRL